MIDENMLMHKTIKMYFDNNSINNIMMANRDEDWTRLPTIAFRS